MSLRFLLLPPLPIEGETLVTTARLGVEIEGERVWPMLDAEDVYLEIQIDDLLSHLTEFWKPLVLRQTYPIAAMPNRPSAFRTKAEERWERTPAEVAEREDELVCAFEDAHDLSRCFDGYFELPPLWLLRAGERMVVDTRSSLRTVAFTDAIAALSRIGDEIAKILSSHSSKWQKLIDKWSRRDTGDPAVLLAWATSLNQAAATEFAQEGLLSPPETVLDAANDNDELRIAARMASALPADQIRQILFVVCSLGRNEAPKLERLSAHVCAYITNQFGMKRAHEQGEAAAAFVRENFGLTSQAAIDIEALLLDLGVIVEPRNVDPSSLDALAVWGNKYGPAVLLNRNSTRGKNAAARITLAHELCHLLLDHGHAFTAIEILNSKMPLDTERRAKSFAGELLLPSSAAFTSWQHAGSPRSRDGLLDVIEALADQYEVTWSVAAWKLDHGLLRHDIDCSVLIDSIVPTR
jgi:Zn-dependent peptidase ImmA (M78 family)